jgi:hypothetical protein
MRKRYLKDFKAKVAIEAVRGEKTLQELKLSRNFLSYGTASLRMRTKGDVLAWNIS